MIILIENESYGSFVIKQHFKPSIIASKFPCLMNTCRAVRLQGFVTAPFEFRARPILFNVYNTTLVHDLLPHDLLNLCINWMITMHNKCSRKSSYPLSFFGGIIV